MGNVGEEGATTLRLVCQIIGVTCCALNWLILLRMGRSMWRDIFAAKSSSMPTATYRFAIAKFAVLLVACWPSTLFAIAPFYHDYQLACYYMLRVAAVGYVASKFFVYIFYLLKAKLVPSDSQAYTSKVEKIAAVGTAMIIPFAGIAFVFVVGEVSVNQVTCGVFAPVWMAVIMAAADAGLSFLYLYMFVKPLRDLVKILNRPSNHGSGGNGTNRPAGTELLIRRNLRACILSVTSTYIAMIWVMLNDVGLFAPVVRITICTIGCIDELAQVVIIMDLTRQGHGENSPSHQQPPTPIVNGLMTQQRNSKGTYYANGTKAHANPFMSDRGRRSGNKNNDGQLTPLGQLSRAPSQLIPQANGSGDPNHSQSHHSGTGAGGTATNGSRGDSAGNHHPRLIILPPVMSTTIMIQSANNTQASQAHLLASNTSHAGLTSSTNNGNGITSNGLATTTSMLLPHNLMSVSGHHHHHSGLSLSHPMLAKTISAPPTPSTDGEHLHPNTFPLPNTIGSNITEPEPSASAADRAP